MILKPAASPERSTPELKYDKGERRYKHVGNGPDPVIAYDPGQPKKWIGKCPSTLTEADRTRLLNEAIPASNGDRELIGPKKLYVVHEGAIYEAQTSDHGTTFHGYPYQGRLGGSLLRKLKNMAHKKGCANKFRDWVEKHIQRHGA